MGEGHESGETYANAFAGVHTSSVILDPGRHHYFLDQRKPAGGGYAVLESCGCPQKQGGVYHSYDAGIAFGHFD